MEIRYGVEKETTAIDSLGSTLTIIRKVRDSEVAKVQKLFRVRVKVTDSKQETMEYLQFSDAIRDKKEKGILVIKDEDPTTMPCFLIERPKFDKDGSYFIIKGWAEEVQA